MTKKRKFWAVLTALVLCAAIPLALADGNVHTLYQAGTQLLFDTENASLALQADFSYNGVHFKHAELTYQQQDYHSLLDLKLKTPKRDGTILESGYTVFGEEYQAYSIEPVTNPYAYSVTAVTPSRSLLSNTLMRRTLLRLGGAVANAAESALGSFITVDSTAEGARYHIALAEGQTPELVNAAGTLVAQLAADRYFYTDYHTRSAEEEDMEPIDEDYVDIRYTDYDAIFSLYYERLFGEKMPEDFYQQLWGADEAAAKKVEERYHQVLDALYEQLTAPIMEQYTNGVVDILPDGTLQYYDTVDEYYVAKGEQMVIYDDSSIAFRQYYEKRTGKPLSQQEMNAIYSTNNEELYSAFTDLYTQMEEQYLDAVKQDGKASAIHVAADGSTQMIYDLKEFWRIDTYDGYTVARRILYNMDQLELGDTDCTVTLDAQGRLTAASGKACILVIDGAGRRNRLEITFDLAVTDYGTTQVKAFDPAEYGLISMQEYWENPQPLVTEAPVQPAPETVELDGVRYQVRLDE